MLYQINRVPSLAQVKSGVSVAYTDTGHSWSAVCNFFCKSFLKNVGSAQKDCVGYNLSQTTNPISKNAFADALALRFTQDQSRYKNLATSDLRNAIIDHFFKPDKTIFRNSRSHISATTITIDIDNDAINYPAVEFPSLQKLVLQLKLNYIAYSSYSNFMGGRPKFRIIIPLTCTSDGALRRIDRLSIALLQDLNLDAPARIGNVDMTSFQLSRYFYIPNNLSKDINFPNSPDTDFKKPWIFYKTDGENYDINVLLDYRGESLKTFTKKYKRSNKNGSV